MRFATAVLAYAVAGPVGKVVARSAKVPRAPFTWKNLAGPWFNNSIAILEDRDDGLDVRWHTGTVVDGDHLHPRWTRWPTSSSSPADAKPLGSVGEREEQVLHDLHQGRVDPVLPPRDVVRGLTEGHRLHQGLEQVRAAPPRKCAPRISPVSGSAISLAKPVVLLLHGPAVGRVAVPLLRHHVPHALARRPFVR